MLLFYLLGVRFLLLSFSFQRDCLYTVPLFICFAYAFLCYLSPFREIACIR